MYDQLLSIVLPPQEMMQNLFRHSLLEGEILYVYEGQ